MNWALSLRAASCWLHVVCSCRLLSCLLLTAFYLCQFPQFSLVFCRLVILWSIIHTFLFFSSETPFASYQLSLWGSICSLLTRLFQSVWTDLTCSGERRHVTRGHMWGWGWVMLVNAAAVVLHCPQLMCKKTMVTVVTLQIWQTSSACHVLVFIWIKLKGEFMLITRNFCLLSFLASATADSREVTRVSVNQKTFI